MTARVCPVHGEWSATGVCRWCEEPKRMPTNLPTGSVACRCGEYSWEPSCPADMREGVIDRMFHSPAQCFKLDAGPTEYDWTRGPEVKTPEELARVANLDNARPIDGKVVLAAIGAAWVSLLREAAKGPVSRQAVDAAEESRLATQHAALRWERVARRWNYKHRGGGGTEEGRAYVWRWWLEQMDRSAAGLPLAGPFPLGFYAW